MRTGESFPGVNVIWPEADGLLTISTAALKALYVRKHIQSPQNENGFIRFPY